MLVRRAGLALLIIFAGLSGLFAPAQAQQTPPAPAAAPALNILVVDVQALLQNSKSAKTVRQQIEQKRTEYQKEMSAQEGVLRQEHDTLQRQQGSLAAEAFNQKGREFQQKLNDFDKSMQGKRQVLEKANSEALEKINEVMLTDAILEKTTTHTKSLDVLDKQAELRSEIAQLDIAINVAEKQVREEAQQIDRLKKAIATAKQTPYNLIVSGGGPLHFAFVPYDNQSNVAAGSPVYDCYLNMVACRKVGTVKQVFTEEEHAIHPIYRSDIRGFMIQLQLDRPESARSKTIFLNHKPLLF